MMHHEYKLYTQFVLVEFQFNKLDVNYTSKIDDWTQSVINY